jgi:hypothetical protein
VQRGGGSGGEGGGRGGGAWPAAARGMGGLGVCFGGRGGGRGVRGHTDRAACWLGAAGGAERAACSGARCRDFFFFEITAETSVWVLLLPYGQLRANKLSAVSSLLCNSSQAKNGCFPSVLARYAIRTWRRRNTSASIVCLRSRCGFKSVGGPLVVCNLRL